MHRLLQPNYACVCKAVVHLAQCLSWVLAACWVLLLLGTGCCAAGLAAMAPCMLCCDDQCRACAARPAASADGTQVSWPLTRA
jgi:hypothetical protein